MSAAACKEELCQEKAQAMVQTGHWLTEGEHFSDAQLEQWIDLLDTFNSDAEDLILQTTT